MQLGIIGSLAGSTRDVEGAPQPKVALEMALTARPIPRVQEKSIPSPVGLRGAVWRTRTELLPRSGGIPRVCSSSAVPLTVGSTRSGRGRALSTPSGMPSTVARPIPRVQEAEVPVNRGSTRDGRGPHRWCYWGVWRQFSRMQEPIMSTPVVLRGALLAQNGRSSDRA